MWNLIFEVTNMIHSLSCILLEGILKVLNKPNKVFNCYGPFTNHKVFWDVVDEEGFLKDSIVIVGGDLNLVTSNYEI